MSLFIALAALTGIYLGLSIPYWLTKLITKYERNQYQRSMEPTEVNESRLCKETHKWLEVPIIDEDSRSTVLNVCETCGFLPSRNLMSTKAGLERIAIHKKMFALNQKIEQDFLEKENMLLNHLVKQEKFSIEDLVEVYDAGRTAVKRFAIYKIVRAEEENRASSGE